MRKNPPFFGGRREAFSLIVIGFGIYHRPGSSLPEASKASSAYSLFECPGRCIVSLPCKQKRSNYIANLLNGYGKRGRSNRDQNKPKLPTVSIEASGGEATGHGTVKPKSCIPSLWC